MLWKRQRGRSIEAALVPGLGAPSSGLTPAELRTTVHPVSLGFKTTAELEPLTGLIGQERALRAIDFGTDMRAFDYNIFVAGPPASGKRTAIKSMLAKAAKALPPPPDLAYVHNFDVSNSPTALTLPAGRARVLAQAMRTAIEELRTTLTATFEGEETQARRRAIEDEFRQAQESTFEALNRQAQAQNIAILRTPTGFALAPMLEGKVVKPEVFETLPPAFQSDVRGKIEGLEQKLALILEAAPKSDKARRQRLSALDAEVAQLVVDHALADLVKSFADLSAVQTYLDRAAVDIVANASAFLPPASPETEHVGAAQDASLDPRLRRYLVNVLVSDLGSKAASASPAPIVEELNPTYANLLGRIEYRAQMGALDTDHLLIKAGSLHRANGGFLLIDAHKLLALPFAWEALKRSLKASQIRIEPPAETTGPVATQTLEPDPFPLDTKVILFGEPGLYHALAQNDPDFAGLFKVQADFDATIDRSSDNHLAYARVVASIVRTYGLKPFDAGAVARIIEEGARLAEDRDKLSVAIGVLSDVVRESHYWAKDAGAAVVERTHVVRAIEEATHRGSRARDQAQELIGRNIVLIDTDGAKVGQINGLSVLSLGNQRFGQPARITARVRLGAGRVTDIEREVALGGPLHSKGVMILWGYLGGRYGLQAPLSLAATIVFEQSYSGVDGDSASSAELYALMSALSEVPIKQCFAVTGSVNQLGEVQAIGGVNEKIEGFFDICRQRGLSGEHGVLIPAANVQHLMLREDVVEAAERGQFKVHAIAHIEQGIEILTGVKAGEREPSGDFEPGTLNARIESRLKAFADDARRFSQAHLGERGA